MKQPLWKASWLPGLVVTLSCLLAAGSEPLSRLEWSAYDLAVNLASGRPADDRLVVVGIDTESIRQLGPWPWPRDRYAQVVTQLAEADAAVIGLAIPMDTAQNGHSIDYLRHLQHDYADDPQAHEALARAEAGLDTDRALDAAVRKAGNVVFGMYYRAGSSGPRGSLPPLDQALRGFALRDAAANRPVWFDFLPGVLTGGAMTADRLFPPVPTVGAGAAGIGHLYGHPLGARAGGDSLRAVPLALRYGEHYFPSFSLLLAAHSLKIDRSHLQVTLGRGVALQGTEFRTDPALQAYPRYYPGRDGKSPFKTYAFADVYARLIAPAEFRGKTVLIGLTAPALVDAVETPTGEALAPVVAAAHVASNLLNQELFEVPEWAVWVQLLALLVVGLYLMFLLPRLRLATGLALSVVLLFMLGNVHFMLMAVKSQWLPLMAPTVALVLGVFALMARRLVEERSAQLRAQLDQANRSLGQMLQGQGQLDQAFERYRRCAVDGDLLEMLYNLGLDFERKRQFTRAIGVFKHIEHHTPAFRDSHDRVRLNQEMEKRTVLGKGFATSTGDHTLAATFEKLQKPMLGRYQVEREIGRGAMGMVYLGHDPRIGRTVAIKTMVLAQEFDEDQLADVRARFFREAETVGRLNHPNIVTVYDVGEEQELAYMAMDYLQGSPLSVWCRPDNLLPALTVFDIIIKVAEALDYAHGQQVVHRDIKPANIMYDDTTGTVKVTDFGVACLIDSSKTKTGTVLGSPSYMSPEQLAGKKVDGRSDLFSLGVTLFQLLTGELPFVADSLASLMYKITNEKHVDVRVLRPDLPACVSTIVNRTLYKDIEKRVQSGHHLANAMRRCKERLTK